MRRLVQLVLPPSPVRSDTAPAARYVARLATHADEIRAAQALRFAVFNLELGEGLLASYADGRDADPFDAVCDHLIVEDEAQHTIVGTYRLQTGTRASRSPGYYSEREFDFRPFEHERGRILELGRACIHADHRSLTVLSLLWRGIAQFARVAGARYLMGCSSLTTRDPAVGATAHRQLRAQLAPAEWRTLPRAEWACPLESQGDGAAPVPIPKLLAAYLALGARVCGPPAIDREFGTVDFLTWFDLESPDPAAARARDRFLA